MRNREAWLATFAALLGVSEEACRNEAPRTDVATVAPSSTPPSVAASEPSATASAEVLPSATASASASVAKIVKPPPTATLTPGDLSQAICGAVPNELPHMNASCGATANPIPNAHLACGGGGITRPPTTVRPTAVITVNLTNGATGDDRVAAMLRPRLRACANQALALDPTQQGKLTVSVAIAPNGEVSNATIASTTGISQASAQCMTRGVKNMQFPASGATRSVTLTIVQTIQSP